MIIRFACSLLFHHADVSSVYVYGRLVPTDRAENLAKAAIFSATHPPAEADGMSGRDDFMRMKLRIAFDSSCFTMSAFRKHCLRSVGTNRPHLEIDAIEQAEI